MPDQLPSAILDSTNSFDSIFALDIDTKQRFDNILNNQQKPIDYPLPDYNKDSNPRGLPQDYLLNPQKMAGTLGEALFSTDPRIAAYATDKMRAGQAKLPVNQGIGVPDSFEYSKEMDKFLKGDYGYNPYMSLEDNEDFNYRYDYMSHSLAGRFLRNMGTGLTRFVSSVGLKLGQSLGYMGSMIYNGVEEIFNSKDNNFMTDVADNSMSRWFEGLEGDMKNSNLLSVFKPKGWDDKGFFSKLTNGGFWTDEVADGAAFMGEMVASMYLMGGLGKIGTVGRLGATEINLTKSLGKLGSLGRYTGKALDGALKLGTGADDLAGVGRWAFATTSESAFEASQLYNTRKDELKAQRQAGRNTYTDAEIEAIAGDSAAASFKANMLILSASNAFENRFIFNPLFKRLGVNSPNPRGRLIDVSRSTENLDELAKASRREYSYSTWLGKKLDWKNSNSRLRFYGGRGLSATAVEGFWEENAQLAVERLASADNLSFSTFAEKLKNQTLGSLPFTNTNDPEAQTNIGLGGLIGIGGTSIVSKVSGGDRLFQGERRKIEDDTQRAVQVYEQTRRNFLNFQDIYVRDADNGKPKLDDDGNLQIDPVKAAAVFDGINAFSSKQEAASKVNDPLFRKFLQDSAMMDYVTASKNAGIFNRAINRFNTLGNLTVGELENLGFDPNTTVDTTYLRDSMKEFGKIYEEVQSMPAARRGKTDTIEDELSRKHALYKAKATVYSTTKLINEYQSAMLDRDFPSAFSPEAEGNTSEVQAYNSLVFQKEALDQWAALAQDHGNFYNPFITAERGKINAEMARLETIFDDMMDNTNLNIQVTPRGFVVSTDKYDYLKPTTQEVLTEAEADLKKRTIAKMRNDAKDGKAMRETEMSMDIEYEAQRKHAQMTNERSRHSFLSQKFASIQDGIQNYKDYLKFMESIQKKDEQTNPPAPPTTPPTAPATGQPTAPQQPAEQPPAQAPAAPEMSRKEVIDAERVIIGLTSLLSQNRAAFIMNDLPDYTGIATFIDENLDSNRKAIETSLLNFIRDPGEVVMDQIRANTFSAEQNISMNAYRRSADFIDSLMDSVDDEALRESVSNYLNSVDDAIEAYKPARAELTENEKAAVGILAFIKLVGTRLEPYTSMLFHATATNQSKKEALHYISDQLFAPATAEEIGTILGRAGTQAIEDLGYPAPQESEGVSQISAEAPVQATQALINLFADRIAKGETMTDPDDIQFYENNKDAIETRLRELQAQQGQSNVSLDSQKADIERRRQEEHQQVRADYDRKKLDSTQLIEKNKEINAKYDTELAALGSTQEDVQSSEKQQLEKELSELKSEKAQIEKELIDALKVRDLYEQAKQKAQEEAERLSAEEKQEVAQELGITEEQVAPTVAEAVVEEMSTGQETPRAPKQSVFRRVINKIKRALLALFAAGTLWTGAGGTTITNGSINWSKNTLVDRTIAPLPEEQEQWAKRFLEKQGVYESQDAILAVTPSLEDSVAEISSPIDSNRVKPTLEILGTVPDSYNSNDSLIAYRSTWNNSDGFEYVAGPNRGQGKSVQGIPGVVGVGHFLLDGSLFGNSQYSHGNNYFFFQKAKQNDEYVPAFRKLPEGRVLLTYKRYSALSEDDVLVSPLRQFRLSEIDWIKSGKAKGFASSIKELKRKDGQGTYLIFKDLNGYSRFSGGSVVFIFQKGDNTIVVDFAGSINMIKNEAERIQREYNLSPEDVTVGYHDVGSFSAKPKAHNGTIYPSQYSGYNNDNNTGGSLLIPIQPPASNKSAALFVLPLLGAIRRRRQNGEHITDDEIGTLRTRLQEIDDRIGHIQNRLNILATTPEPVAETPELQQPEPIAETLVAQPATPQLGVGDIVIVATEKDGVSRIKELRGNKALLEDGRQVSLANLTKTEPQQPEPVAEQSLLDTVTDFEQSPGFGAPTQAQKATADTEGSGVQPDLPPPPTEPPVPPKIPENSDEASVEQSNFIDIQVDEAKRNGRFSFVQNMAEEIVMEGDKAKITNGAIQLKTTTGNQQRQLLRQHNILKRMGDRNNPVNFFSEDEEGNPLYKMQLKLAGIRYADDYASWVYDTAKGKVNPTTGKPYSFPYIIAAVVDQNGDYVYFDDQGNVTTKGRGLPFGFPYVVEDYKGQNLDVSRRGLQLGTMESLNGVPGYLNDNPLGDISTALQRGVELYATIDLVTSGKLSTYNVDNSGATWAKAPQQRSVAQMELDGDINDTSTLVLASGNYITYPLTTASDTRKQEIKVGQPFLFDDKSGLRLPLRGKKIKDLTVDGKPFVTGQLKEAIEGLVKERRISLDVDFMTPENYQFMENLFNMLRALVYSQSTPVFISEDRSTITMLDQRPTHSSLMETEINYSTGITILSNPFEAEDEGFSYEEFVKENFLSGAVPAELVKGDKAFEKLNQRVIFTLEKDHQQILDSVGSTAQTKSIRMKATDFTKFVNKTYRKKGGTSTVTITGFSDGKFTIEGPSGSVVQSTTDFIKALRNLEEVKLPAPSEEVRDDFENNIKLSQDEQKALNEQAKNMSQEDLDNLDFNC